MTVPLNKGRRDDRSLSLDSSVRSTTVDIISHRYIAIYFVYYFGVWVLLARNFASVSGTRIDLRAVISSRHVSQRERERERNRRTSLCRYIDTSRPIVLAISHARALHLAEGQKKNQVVGQKKKQVQYHRIGLASMMSVSLSLLPSTLPLSLSFVSFIIIIIIGDCARLHDPRRVRNRRNRRQSARRSDRLRFSRRRETAKRPRSTLRCFSAYIGSESRQRNGLRFAPRLVAPNHNETCQGAYLREHLKSDFYLLAFLSASLFPLFSASLSLFFFRPASRSRLSCRTVHPRQDVAPRYSGTSDSEVRMVAQSDETSLTMAFHFYFHRLSQPRDTFCSLF